MASKRYGYAHRRLRERWRPRVERGEIACAECGLPIVPGEAWDLAHDRHDETQAATPGHARCNRNSVVDKRLQRQRPRRFHWRSPEW